MSEALSRPRRGRPPRIDREAILVAAEQIAHERGPETLTMRRIAGAVGVDAGALYGHFAGKAALLQALSARAAERLRPVEPTRGDWRARTRATCAMLRRSFAERPELDLLGGEWEALAPFNARATALITEALAGSGLDARARLLLSQNLLYQITAVARLETGLARSSTEHARAYHASVIDAIEPALRDAWRDWMREPADDAFEAVYADGIDRLLASVGAPPER